MSRPKYRTTQRSRGKIRKIKKMGIGIIIMVLILISIVISIILVAVPLL